MLIKLLKPHTHAGRDYPAGSTLDVPHSVAVWLDEQGVADGHGDVRMNSHLPPQPVGSNSFEQDHKKPAKPRSTPVQTARKEG